MRSFGFTLILGLLAVLVCGLASWQWVQGNFDSVFGAPPVAVGQRIYSSFTPAEVKHIQVSQNGVNNTFELGPNGWQGVLPWRDRMDSRAAVSIIQFTLNLRVEDFAKVSEIDGREAGLKESGITIRLEDADHRPLVKYKLGRQTPWLATVADAENPVPTVFIQPRDSGHKRYIYACAGDIAPLFRDGLKFLRDHRPFYFNPTALKTIRIRAEQGELTLGRETRDSPWRLTKPLNLATDPKAIKALLEGLYELRAAKISDRASVTLPAIGILAKSSQISVMSFDSEIETTLEIFPPETPESSEVRAMVSDRPDTVFDLPLSPSPNVVSLADLPLAVNDLRDTALTNLNIKSLRGVLIQPSTGAEILIARTPPQPWMATIEGQSQEANDDRLFSLLKTATEGRVIEFMTDAATDFAPWGLDRPFLKLRFLGQENQALELAFGIDGKGGYFVNRLGTPTVMRVDPALIASIPVRPYEWRPSRLWSIDRVNLVAIRRQTGTDPPLTLLYDFASEEWTANSNSEDLTPSLDPARATALLASLEGLKVTRWLSPDDSSATTALRNPSLVCMVLERETDETGEVNGRTIKREVLLAPASAAPNPGFYYGRLGADAHPFMLDRDTYRKLAANLLEKE